MLSRQVLNATRVASKRVIAPATQSVRTFKTVHQQQNAEEIKAGKVLTVTYKDGVRQEVEIPVEQSPAGPVAPPGADEKKPAVPLEKSILNQLNPTMAKFTLPGKVAVVTG